MQFWRSPLRLLGVVCAGIILVLALHACQTVDPSASVLASQPSPTEQVETPANGLGDSSSGNLRVVVISDLNGPYGSTDYDPEIDLAMELIPQWQPDLVLCAGDMVAGQKQSLTNPQLQAMWSAFDVHVAAPLRRAGIPLGITMGNHDASSSKNSAGVFAFARERQIANRYWNLPSHDPGVNFVDRHEFPFNYTFTTGDVFVLAWDASSFKIAPETLAWAEQALQSPAAQAARLKIVLGHLPLYAIAEGRNAPGNVLAHADELYQLLERHQVHTYITGHHHAYYPGKKGNLQLLHSGLLGSGPRPLLGQPRSRRKTLTVIDINTNAPEPTRYTTYDLQTGQQIPLEQLPPSITGHNGVVQRRDIVM